MQARVAGRVKDGQQDEAGGADDGEDDGQARQDLLAEGGVGDEAAAVAQDAVGEEGQVQENGGEAAAGDEERLELGGADVADVGDALAVLHGAVDLAARVDVPVDQEGEQRGQPEDAGYDGQDLFGWAY